MATEDQVILETDYNYVAVCRVDGPARAEDGTLCVLEIGRGSEAPNDAEAIFLPVDQVGIEALLSALGAVV